MGHPRGHATNRVHPTGCSAGNRQPSTVNRYAAWARRSCPPRVLTGLALALALAIAQAAGGKHAEPVESLLPQCQGESAPISPDCGLTPTPAFDAQGRLWLAFVQNDHVYVVRSDDLGKSFQPPVAVNATPEAIYNDGENRPKLAFGPQGDLYVSWTHKGAERFVGHIRFARSTDGGKSFGPVLTVNDDLSATSHRFESMAVDGQGRIHIVWVDKRDLDRAKQAGEAYAGAAIYYAVSSDRGQSFAPNRKAADHSCECCRVALAVDEKDRVVTLWRHIYPTNLRDHAIARLGPDSAPIEGLPVRASDDGWVVEGCPHHGPALALGRDGQAHLAWFTQGEKGPGIRYGRFDLETNTLQIQHGMDASAAAARPQVAVVGGRVYTAWKAFDGSVTQLLVRHSGDEGASWSAPLNLAATAEGSDFPLLVSHADRLYASWHSRAEGYRLIPVTPAGEDR